MTTAIDITDVTHGGRDRDSILSRLRQVGAEVRRSGIKSLDLQRNSLAGTIPSRSVETDQGWETAALMEALSGSGVVELNLQYNNMGPPLGSRWRTGSKRIAR